MKITLKDTNSDREVDIAHDWNGRIRIERLDGAGTIHLDGRELIEAVQALLRANEAKPLLGSRLPGRF